MTFWLDERIWAAIATGLGMLAAGAAVWALILANKSNDKKDAELLAFQRQSEVSIIAAAAQAKVAEARAAEARGVAAKAEQKAAEASNNLAQANAAAALAQKDAAEARLETVKIKALVAWREISSENRARFKQLLDSLPKGPVRVESVASNPEAANFARLISEMLSESGFTVTNNFGSHMLFGPPPIGVQMKIENAELPPKHALSLQQALRVIGIEALAQISPDLKDTVVVFVGNKS